jgi:hypothetical protein
MRQMNPDKLMTYCGSYCSTCARWHGFRAFRAAAALLAESVDAHGFHHWLPEMASGFDHEEFRKGLRFFADENSWLVCSKPCREGSGGPPECVRECCREHRADVCWECEEFPCERAAENPSLMDGAESHRELGRAEWLRRRAEAAARGYEAHTGMCYRVSVLPGECAGPSLRGDER